MSDGTKRVLLSKLHFLKINRSIFKLMIESLTCYLFINNLSKLKYIKVIILYLQKHNIFCDRCFFNTITKLLFLSNQTSNF